VADLQIRRLAQIFQILGLLADGAIRIKFVPRPGDHRTGEGDMMLEPAVRPEDYAGLHDAIRADDGTWTDLRLRIDDGGRMDLRIAH
jgi:hypothetical protein